MVTRLTLAYDGSGFAGWARQPGQRTVEEELQRALGTVLPTPVQVTAAGRTDRGVHAWQQVVSYPDEAVDPRTLNALLPRDVAVASSEPAHEGFDARHDALSRRYCYRLFTRPVRDPFERGRSLWWTRPLDRERLHDCAAALVGSHDFTAFTPTETGHARFSRRVLSAQWRERGDVLEFWIEADSFLRHMNRVLIGTMLEVGEGRRSVDSLRWLLDGGTRAQAGTTAPPHGLYLAGVSYPPPS